MLTISKALSASQAEIYHREEFANAQANYYSEGESIRGEWHGKLAEQWGLRGEVDQEQFARLANGQHPTTGEQLVRHTAPREYLDARGETVKPMEHRAGWDATFSAPKSISLTALVGGDDDLRQAHRESVRIAIDELEKYVQARMGGNRPAETTGKWVAASFEHDSARPVEGYAAPQLHTHVVFFNLTETETGESRALQPRELYRSQQYGTAIYRSELALRMKELGYEVEQGKAASQKLEVIPANIWRPPAHGVSRSEIILNNMAFTVRVQHRSQRIRHGMRSSPLLLTKKCSLNTEISRLSSVISQSVSSVRRAIGKWRNTARTRSSSTLNPRSPMRAKKIWNANQWWTSATSCVIH